MQYIASTSVGGSISPACKTLNQIWVDNGQWMFETNETFKEKDIDSATMFYPAWCQFRICKFTVQDFEETIVLKYLF